MRMYVYWEGSRYEQDIQDFYSRMHGYFNDQSSFLGSNYLGN